MEGITVLIIMTMSYGLIEILKTSLKNEKFMALIPAITASFGAVLGLLIHFWVPQLTPHTNFLESLIVGILSGLSSTGTHQISKQIQKFKNPTTNSPYSPPKQDKNNSNDDSSNFL